MFEDIAIRQQVDATYHLGDLIGYSPWPNEVVDALRAAGIPGVAGNYDSTVATGYKHCGCRSETPHQEALAHRSFAWTLEHTTEESKRFLHGLPFRIDIRPFGGHHAAPTVRLLHGSQVLNTVHVTEDRSEAFLTKMAEAMGAASGDVICFGHTHMPWHRTVGGVHFVNTGSVGRPKDGDPRAGYAVLVVNESGVAVELTDHAPSASRNSRVPSGPVSRNQSVSAGAASSMVNVRKGQHDRSRPTKRATSSSADASKR